MSSERQAKITHVHTHFSHLLILLTYVHAIRISKIQLNLQHHSTQTLLNLKKKEFRTKNYQTSLSKGKGCMGLGEGSSLLEIV